MKNEKNPPEISLLDLRGDIRKLAVRVQSLEDSQVVRTDLSEFLKSTDAASTYATQEAISDMQTASDAAKTYAKKNEIPDTSGFLISNDLSGINKAIQGLESKNEALYKNLSMKVINHTFNEPGEITLLPVGSKCSGKIFISTENKPMGKEYIEYDFKCRQGPSPRNPEHLNKLKQVSYVASWLKGYAIGCDFKEGKLVLIQRSPAYANDQWSHKVSVRVIGWANE